MPPQSTLLIVDDDELVLDSGRRLFEEFGYRVVTASSKAAALCAFHDHLPSVAVIDISIPKHPDDQRAPNLTNGLDLAFEIKELNREVGIVLLSAYMTHGRAFYDTINSRGLNGMAYMFKGNAISKLLQAIDDVVDGRIVADPLVQSLKPQTHSSLRDMLTDDEREVIVKAVDNMPALSKQERKVAALAAKAQRNQAIARQLETAVKTIDAHIQNIYHKTGIDLAPAHLVRATLLSKAIAIFEWEQPNEGS